MPGDKSLFKMEDDSAYGDEISLTSEAPILRKTMMREACAEFLGTMILVLVGDGVVCQTVVSQGLEMERAMKKEVNPDLSSYAGDWGTISFGYGIALMMGLFVSAGVSGGHLNPAVTIAMCRHNRLPWKKAPYYIGAQFAGAFVGALIVFIGYWPGLSALDSWEIGTAGIFATYPKEHEGVMAGFLDEVIGSFLLLLGIFAVTDKFNNEPDNGLKPMVIGIILTGIALSFGYNTGFALNPARDFSPRLFTAMAGWGGQVFTYANGYFWVPLIAPIFGSLAGAELYTAMIARYHPNRYVAPSDEA